MNCPVIAFCIPLGYNPAIQSEVKYGMVHLTEVDLESKALLWKLLQQYLREMAAYYDLEKNADGNHTYRYFDAYFTEAGRRAYLITDDGSTAGFAMVNPYSYIGEAPDYVLAEFFILPKCRGNHIGTAAAQQLLQSFPGKWEIKYSERNRAAEKFWSLVTAQYKPAKRSIGEDETVLAFVS